MSEIRPESAAVAGCLSVPHEMNQSMNINDSKCPTHGLELTKVLDSLICEKCYAEAMGLGTGQPDGAPQNDSRRTRSDCDLSPPSVSAGGKPQQEASATNSISPEAVAEGVWRMMRENGLLLEDVIKVATYLLIGVGHHAPASDEELLCRVEDKMAAAREKFAGAKCEAAALGPPADTSVLNKPGSLKP